MMHRIAALLCITFICEFRAHTGAVRIPAIYSGYNVLPVGESQVKTLRYIPNYSITPRFILSRPIRRHTGYEFLGKRSAPTKSSLEFDDENQTGIQENLHTELKNGQLSNNYTSKDSENTQIIDETKREQNIISDNHELQNLLALLEHNNDYNPGKRFGLSPLRTQSFNYFGLRGHSLGSEFLGKRNYLDDPKRNKRNSKRAIGAEFLGKRQIETEFLDRSGQTLENGSHDPKVDYQRKRNSEHEIANKDNFGVDYTGKRALGAEFLGKRDFDSEFSGKRAIGAEFLGKRAIGAEFLGKRALGAEFLGKRALGAEFLGKRALQGYYPSKKALGAEFLGKRALGAEFLGKRAIGAEFLGKRATGPENFEKRVLGAEFLGKRGLGAEYLGKHGSGEYLGKISYIIPTQEYVASQDTLLNSTPTELFYSPEENHKLLNQAENNGNHPPPFYLAPNEQMENSFFNNVNSGLFENHNNPDFKIIRLNKGSRYARCIWC